MAKPKREAPKMEPASPELAPDPARVYGREKPHLEAGMGRMDEVKATPTPSPDKMEHAVGNKQPLRQINAEDEVNQRGTSPARPQPDHSMKDEEPLGSDQAPADIKDPRQKRHPRKEGKGGTP